MSRDVRFVVCAALSALGFVAYVSAQTPQITQNPDVPPTWIPDIKFASGREIVPYLEGWIKNPDGSFDFVFGYFNRNQEQELVDCRQVLRTLSCRADPTADSRRISLRNGSRGCTACACPRTGETRR